MRVEGDTSLLQSELQPYCACSNIPNLEIAVAEGWARRLEGTSSAKLLNDFLEDAHDALSPRQTAVARCNIANPRPANTRSQVPGAALIGSTVAYLKTGILMMRWPTFATALPRVGQSHL